MGLSIYNSIHKLLYLICLFLLATAMKNENKGKAKYILASTADGIVHYSNDWKISKDLKRCAVLQKFNY